MDLKDGNNFMASFYNIKGYGLTAFFHCVTFSEKQGKAKLGSHALELMVYNTVYEDCGYIGSKKISYNIK